MSPKSDFGSPKNRTSATSQANYQLPTTYYHIIFANPPYIANKDIKKVQNSTLFFEPKKALFAPLEANPLTGFAKDNGLFFIKKFLGQAKKYLAKNGKIYILNMPDLSQTSGVVMLAKTMHQPLKYLFVRSIHRMTKDYNLLLREKIKNKNTIVDMNALFQNMLRHPSHFNITNIENNCEAAHAFPACKGYLFYDIKHPTTAVHKEIAKDIQMVLKLA